MNFKKGDDEKKDWIELPIKVSPARLPGLGKLSKPAVIFAAFSIFFVLLGISPSLMSSESTTLTSTSPTSADPLTPSPISNGDSKDIDDFAGPETNDVTEVEDEGETDLESATETTAAVAATGSAPLGSEGGSQQLAASPRPTTNSVASPSTGTLVKMPNLVGLTFAHGTIVNSRAGFGHLGPITMVCSDSIAEGRIVEQVPLPGTEIDFSEWTHAENATRIGISTGPCRSQNANSGNLFTPGAGTRISFVPGLRQGSLFFRSAYFFENNGALSFAWNFDGTRSAEDTLVDMASTCSIRLNFTHNAPCLNEMGERHGRVLVPAGEERRVVFFVNLSGLGVSRPDQFDVSFATESQVSGRIIQSLNVEIFSWERR